MNQEWVTRPERGSVWSIRFIVWFALTFGRRATRVLLYPICIYFIIFSLKARPASRNYLNRVLGRRAKFRDIFRHYFYFSATILDRVYFLNEQNALFDFHVQGDEIFKEIISGEGGHFLTGAHMGSFEALNTFGRSHGHYKTSMVMYEENALKLIAMLKNINPRRNLPVISLGKIDSMLKIREALEQGEYIGILADRAISGEKMITCEFLGGQIDLPAGPFRLAALLERQMFLVLGLYQGGNRYNIYIELLADMQNVPHSKRDAAVEQAAHQFARRLEHYCRESPYNWFNFYDIWK